MQQHSLYNFSIVEEQDDDYVRVSLKYGNGYHNYCDVEKLDKRKKVIFYGTKCTGNNLIS